MSERFIVCRESGHGGATTYRTVTLYEGEAAEAATDSVDGSSVTVIRRGREVVSSAGELCGEFADAREARVQAGRLQRALEIMES
jgi:hypothetical protein